MICPLCLGKDPELYDKDKERSFFQCPHCGLVFVPRSDLISLHTEKERYEAHDNASDNSGYVNYLTKIADSIDRKLKPNSFGLDFGSGKTTVLEEILENRGHELISYDVFFHPDEGYKKKQYDFIIMSEVIEHLRDPREEMISLKKLLKDDGMLFIKTKFLPEKNFSTWFYKRDITHVQFFSWKSFKTLSELLELEPSEEVGEDLYLLRNNRGKVI